MTFEDGGRALEIGKPGEERVLAWLEACRSCGLLHGIIDMREFRLAQRLDVDCGLETVDSALVTAEIKTDKKIASTGNFFFELFRINYHLSSDQVFYLGWAFRSPAKYLLCYSPQEDRVYRILFSDVRTAIARLAENEKRYLRSQVVYVETDVHRLTVGLIVPKRYLEGRYVTFNVADVLPQTARKPA